MTGVVLDTHAWIWWSADRDRLSARARDAIERAETIGVAAISCWEVAMLEKRRRIRLDRPVADWIRRALSAPGVLAIPLDPAVAVAAALLEDSAFPPDPADRLIYSTARGRGAPLVTRDRAIAEFDPRLTVW